ncbi:hypothetical protein PRIPAC_95494 [Pristionchus pacificus]|uniref:Uncharacterized protein n=1 Tax=Pristionchus pacificus TaxID=54126 RepID=A0A454XVF7_PRIPA|nr:hypothetical protein PRIPAC_95494 [Pristionchus pacificus]|eukprot:PDM63645.1 hypothetical protein PRIPAC_49618 [Pristionchus pacificus]
MAFEPQPLYVDAPRLLHAKNSRFVCKEKIELLKKSKLEDASLLPFLTGAEVLNNRYLSEKPGDFPNIVNMLNKCNATIADRLIYMLSEVYNNRIPIDNVKSQIGSRLNEIFQAEIIRACTIQIFNIWIKDFANWVDRETSRGTYCCSFMITNYLHEMMKEKSYNYGFYDREQLELIEMEMEWLNKKIPEGPIDGINQRFLVECMKRGRNLLFARELMTNPDSNYELFRYIQKDGVWFFKEFTAVSLSCDLWITDYNTLV